MGGFDLRCSLSGLPLTGTTALMLLDEAPVVLPLFGNYDGYGGVELTKRSLTADALWSLEKTSGHPAQADLETLSQMLRGDFDARAQDPDGGRLGPACLGEQPESVVSG